MSVAQWGGRLDHSLQVEPQGELQIGWRERERERERERGGGGGGGLGGWGEDRSTYIIMMYMHTIVHKSLQMYK